MQGQSSATIDKERRIASAISVCMRVASYKTFTYPYWHFDANAGNGWNDKVNVPGTPLVFWYLANELMPQMRIQAFFSEIIKKSTRDLQRHFIGIPRAIANSFIIPGDNAEAIEVFAECLRRSGEKTRYMAGSVIVDPNGYFFRNKSGHGVPVLQLIEFTKEFPRIDIILNLNMRTFRLQQPHGHDVVEPRVIFSQLNKISWIVGLTACGGDSFLLAVGRNKDYGGHRGVGLHSINSFEGRHILNVATGKRQQELFDVPRLQKLSSPSGIFSRKGTGDAES